ncbi:MAG: hypothetical protein OXG05_09020 [Gammaproteobacteria bacterium]|nr:hypothetical protein [Gammaproteobacteria bacterium]
MNLKSLSAAAMACGLIAVAQGQTPETAPVAATPPIDRVAGMAIEDMRAAIQLRFDRLDTDKDGFVSKEEFPGPRGSATGNQRPPGNAAGRGNDRPRMRDQAPQRQARMPMRWRSFDDYDSDKDGQVSIDEMAAPIDELASLDTNGDGRLDRREMRANRQPQDAAKKAPKSTQ